LIARERDAKTDSIERRLRVDAQRQNPGAKYVIALLNGSPDSGRFILAFHRLQ
jgi:hypothetical protein